MQIKSLKLHTYTHIHFDTLTRRWLKTKHTHTLLKVQVYMGALKKQLSKRPQSNSQSVCLCGHYYHNECEVFTLMAIVQ